MRTVSLRHLAIVGLAAASATITMATAPVMAATSHTYTFPANGGPASHTFNLGNSNLTVTVGPATAVAGAVTSDTYSHAYVSALDTGTGANKGFRTVLGGNWQWDGTWAFVWGADPTCTSSHAFIGYCGAKTSGVEMPKAMIWEDAGYSTVNDNMSTFNLYIFLYGSGRVQVVVTGP